MIVVSNPACSVPPWLGNPCPIHRPRPIPPRPPVDPPVIIVLPVEPEDPNQ